MAYNYDKVAGIYDRFSRLIFGDTQVRAQRWSLPFIAPGARVLIAGGGTGWVLEDIAGLHPAGLTITYVDASDKMMRLAMRRNIGDNKVAFITAKAESLAETDVYDVVLTPFLFDNFGQVAAERLFHTLDARLAGGGLWLYCDFMDTGKWKHRLLLRTMYMFFRLCCGIAAKEMPGTTGFFKDYNVMAKEAFMDGFITSIAYRKAGELPD